MRGQVIVEKVKWDIPVKKSARYSLTVDISKKNYFRLQQTKLNIRAEGSHFCMGDFIDTILDKHFEGVK